MGKHSWIFQTFRTILLFLGVIALFLLYWSNLLQEEELKKIHHKITAVQSQIDQSSFTSVGGSHAMEQELKDLLHQVLQKQGDPRALDVAMQEGDNLYTKDPYFEKTLPSQLPKGFSPLGIRHEATYGKPENLHPFSGWADVSSWQGMCQVTTGGGHFGRYESYAPELAYKLEEKESPQTGEKEYWLYLRKGVMWKPLQQAHFPADVKIAQHFLQPHEVTAHDIKFWLDAIMNPFNQMPAALSLRNYLSDIEEVKIIDDHTMVVRWKSEDVTLNGETKKLPKYIAKGWTGALRPLPRWVYQYFSDGTKIIEDDTDPDTYRKNSVWAENFANHWAKNVIVSSGPWVFDGMSDRQIRFRRNPNHYDPYAVLVQGMVQDLKDSPDTIWQDFRSGKLDTYALRPEQLVELEGFLESDQYQTQKERGDGIERLDYLARSYAYIGWNQARPLFKDAKVRRALTMAIDRKRIIDQILNGMGEQISGPFYKYSPSTNPKIDPLPFDPTESERILEELGWYDSDGDGVIDKEINGKRVPFSFSITYFVKNPTTKSIVEYIVVALKKIGIQVHLNGVDRADLSAAFEDKDFDALTMFWGLGSPPEEPRQLWHSEGALQKGSSNFVGFANPQADQIIEDLLYEYNPEKRKELYHRFHHIIAEEQPYTFLYSPKSVLLYRNRVKNAFIPKERQDLVPGADVSSPQPSVFWLDVRGE